jgi:hypothetical protein
MIPGIAITMGDREWTIPPLTLGQLRRLMPKVRQLSDINAQIGETQIAVMVEIVTAALQRNYPDITAETVENLLDLGNSGPVLTAVLTGSGLRPPGLASGEAIAPEPGSGASMLIQARIGETSMASSQPLADTATR